MDQNSLIATTMPFCFKMACILQQAMKAKKTGSQLEAEIKKLRKQLRDADYLAGKFVGSKRKGKKIRHFHRPDCEWADYLTPQNLIEFNSHQEAVDAGYKPCKS